MTIQSYTFDDLIRLEKHYQMKHITVEEWRNELDRWIIRAGAADLDFLAIAIRAYDAIDK